jgi:hypothetical protein
MLHYLFLGHFEHDGELVRFAKTASDPVYRPVIRLPIDTEAIQAALQEVKGAEVDDLAFPDDWRVWLGDGFLVCDRHTRNREAIDFVTRLVRRTSCDICDASTHSDIMLHDWLAVTHDFAKP